MEIVGILVTVVLGIFGLIQWLISERHDRHTQDRQRDTELTAWGAAVLNAMAKLELTCDPIGPAAPSSIDDINLQAARLSALVDEGRLFFPNVEVEGTRKGYRIKLLDEVLRAYYCAAHFALYGSENGPYLRDQVWRARRRFVDLLQQHVRKTLNEVTVEHGGDSIPSNPLAWAQLSRSDD